MRFPLTFIATSVLLVACGGGSDSAPIAGSPASVATLNTPTPVGPSTPAATSATLTSANYMTVAQEALSSSAFLATATEIVTGAQTSNPEVMVRFAQAQLSKLQHRLSSVPAVAVGVVSTDTVSCDGGGSLTISENDVNGNQSADSGDSGSITATNCAFEGSLLNGELIVTFLSVTGDTNFFPFNTSASVKFNNFGAQVGLVRSVGNGTLVMSVDARAANNLFVALSTSSFGFSTVNSGITYTKSLTNYASSVGTSPAAGGVTSTTSTSGMLSSSAFDSKSVDIATPTPFVRAGTQAYPSSGQLLITGASGSKIRLSATSATQIRIELDADANGSYETSISKLWSEML